MKIGDTVKDKLGLAALVTVLLALLYTMGRTARALESSEAQVTQALKDYRTLQNVVHNLEAEPGATIHFTNFGTGYECKRFVGEAP